MLLRFLHFFIFLHLKREKSLSRTFQNLKKRYAYLVDWKPEKFQSTTRIAQWLSRHSVGCYIHICRKGFLRTSSLRRGMQFHASRLNKKLPRDWEEHGGFTICISCGIHFLCSVIFLKETSRFIFPYVQLLLLYKMKNHM